MIPTQTNDGVVRDPRALATFVWLLFPHSQVPILHRIQGVLAAHDITVINAYIVLAVMCLCTITLNRYFCCVRYTARNFS